MRQLSILCVTKCEPHAWRFLANLACDALTADAELVIGVDGLTADLHEQIRTLAQGVNSKVVGLHGRGYVESMLDEALSHCEGEYVLRMDDDEQCSVAMRRWLVDEEYLTHSHWKFCTANLWRDAQTVLTNPPVWPDHHTRLSTRALAGGRTTPHAGSPHGGGELAPVIHEHHKFLVKSFEERRSVAARYDAYQAGYGTGDGLRPFSLPETCYDELVLAPLGDGTVREWRPDELEMVRIVKEVA